MNVKWNGYLLKKADGLIIHNRKQVTKLLRIVKSE